MDNASKLEFHYYFNDESHSMNALVRNKCESEVLAIVNEVISLLRLNLSVDSEAYREGGLKERWCFDSKGHPFAVTFLTTVVQTLISQVPQTESDYQELNEGYPKFSEGERAQVIKQVTEAVKQGEVGADIQQRFIALLNENYKIITRRSNLFKIMAGYQKIDHISLSVLGEEGQAISSEKSVERSHFKRFVMSSSILKPVIIEGATIEIVAPVLTDERARWKGLYEGEMISFSMDDEDFKDSVLTKRVGFKNGSSFKCVLHLSKKLNALGEVVTTGYSVETVLENMTGGVARETAQGKRYRFHKKQKDLQGDLFG